MKMTEELKTLFAMLLGGATSITTLISGSINNFNLQMATVQVLSIEYATMLLTALLVGAAGALGGLIIREGYKLIVSWFKGDSLTNTKSSKEDEN
jgi:hypothetical protein